ncbi:MAG TPA: NADPH:quinone oxidoreductase family protein, partial [Terriglobales bacterium]
YTIFRMKAIVVTASTGPDGLKLQEVPDPQPRQNSSDVIVNVEAVGVNFADALGAQGRYPGGPKPPYVAGREFAGTIAETGERVMGYCQYGACAEKIAISRKALWPQFAGWSSAQSAAFPVNFLTAYLLYWKAGLTPLPADPSPHTTAKRPRVLIHAAAGGVGTACVQLGRLLGVETFGTASSDDKLNRLKELGLNHPINYTQEDYEERVLGLTRGQGVDAVFDSLGGEHTAKSLRCCAFLGRVILFGTATGERPKFDTMALYSKGASAHGLWLSKLAENHDLINSALAAMKPWVESGDLKPVIGAKFPLASTADAYKLLLERKSFGKLVVTI